jgi:hypothetical protein
MNKETKSIIISILLSLLILVLIITCEKETTQTVCIEAPTNLHWTTVNYKYNGGYLVGGGVNFVWDSVKYATGYNFYIKNTEGVMEFKNKVTSNGAYYYQSIGESVTYSVTALNDKCESNYSKEYTFLLTTKK